MGVAIPGAGYKPSAASGAQVIDGSLVFNGDNQYLTRTPGTVGNRKTWTWSCWIKRDVLTSNQALFSVDNTENFIRFQSDAFHYYDQGQNKLTSSLYRDSFGWYNLILAVDYTASAAADRVKGYINGSQVTWGSVDNTFTDTNGGFNDTVPHEIGRDADGDNDYFGGRMSQCYFIDGQVLEPSDFGYTDRLTNTWRPKKFAGSYTTTSINDGTNWSALNTNGNTGIQPWSKAFNGSGLGATGGSDFAQGSQGAGLFYWEYATGIPISSSLRVYLMNGYPGWADEGFVCNDTTYTTSDLSTEFGTISNQTGGWMTIAAGVHGGSLEKLGCATSSNSDHQTRVVAVEIDGVILVDSADWRGVNSFYLPFDGNSRIGQDQSGKGNDWTPVNFGGSNSIDKATGALPILNTVNGGKVATVGVRTDTSGNNCVFALPLVGNDNDVSNQINSGSTTATITNSGVDFVTTHSNFYGGSGDFTGAATDVLSTGDEDAKFKMEEEDFTIECWVYSTSTSGTQNICQIIGDSSSKYYGIYYSSSALKFQMAGTGGGEADAGDVVFGTERWSHVAMVRNGSTLKGYVDGVEVASAGSITSDMDETGYQAYVGRHSPANNGFTGYIQDFRVYKGVAKYTENFIPASTNPDIRPDTPSGVALSSNLTKITDGAVNFDGSGDYLTVPSSSDLTFGTDDFTIELLVYADNFTNRGTFYDSRASADTIGITIGNEASTGELRVYMNATSGSDIIVQSTDFAIGRWYHVAVTRESGVVRLFVNGVLKDSDTPTSRDLSNTNAVNIGYKTYTSSGYDYFSGKISNFRALKGTALYTSDFTPPSAPLTDITNTKLLCCQSNTSASAAAVVPTISDFYSAGVYLTATTYADRGGSSCTVTNNDSVTSSSAGTNSFGLTTAADMTGEDRVDINMGNVSATFFQSVWTLEMFFKKDANDTNWFVGTSTDGASWQTGWSLNVDGTLKWNYDDQSGGTAKDTGITIDNNTWYFLRVQRTPSTSQSRLYVEVYDSPTNRVGTFDGTVQDDQSHSNNTLKIGDANGNANDLTADWQFANVMITAGTRRNQAVPTLVSGQRVLDASVTAAVSPNGDAAASNFNPFTDNIDTVMGQETGYNSWNPLLNLNNTLSDGNLLATGHSGGAWESTFCTGVMESGKWFIEFTHRGRHTASDNDIQLGLFGLNSPENPYPLASGVDLAQQSTAYVLADGGTSWYNNGSSTSYGVSWGSVGTVVGIRFDADTGKLGFIINGVDQGDIGATLSTSQRWVVAASLRGTGAKAEINFGQNPFKFPPPEGYQPLNLANLPSPGVVRSDKVVTATKWTSTGGSSTYDVDCRLAPDLIWHKCYDGSQNNSVFTSILGPDSRLDTSGNSGEQDWYPAYFTGFTHNGYGVSSTSSDLNPAAGAKMISYCWKAGGSKGTFNKDGIVYASAADAGLDGGSATPSASSVGTKQGFSIIKVAGSNTASKTFSHGLSQAPTFAIGKLLAAAPSNSTDQDWQVYHKVGMGNTKGLQLNLSTTEETSSSLWNDTSPTDTLFSIGASTRWEGNFIMYLWHDVPGMQKFGMYDANGSDTNGPFVYLGFRPAIIMLMCYSGSGENRYIYSDKAGEWQSSLANPNYSPSFLNDNAAANTSTTGYRVDFLSNGFRLRQSNGPNTSSPASKYLYAAWAHQPMNNLYGAQSNAY